MPLPAAAMPAGGPSTDTLVDNVHGETIGADGQVEAVIGLLFDQTGVIRQVFHPGDKLPKKGFGYHVDGQGRVILPGLIDAHVHVMGLGLAALSLDLSDTHSLAEALDQIRAYAAAHPDRTWITGRGWNQEQWGLKDGNGPAAIPPPPNSIGGGRPPGLAGAGRWACRLGQQRRAQGRRHHRRHQGPDGGAIDRRADGTPKACWSMRRWAC
jgi:imidazolonepropionase-like amidohydrolase